MKYFLLSCFITVFLVLVPSCGEKQDPVGATDAGMDGQADGQNQSDDDAVSYSKQIASLLNTHCVSCHATTNSGAQRNGAPIGVDFDTYDSAKASAQRANTRIQAGTMPPAGPLSDEEKALFQSWLDQGTRE